MSGGNAPWFLYGVGAVLAIVLTAFKVPALAFALGMFIPLELNLPLLVGGGIAWFVGSRSKDEKVNKERVDKGTLLASGFIAGGALMGVVSAIINYFGVNLKAKEWMAGAGAQYVGILAYVAIAAYLIYASMKEDKK